MQLTLADEFLNSSSINDKIDFQKELKNIWSELLMVEKISSDSDFFSLGGNSILVLKAVARMTKVFKKEIPHNILFIHPTFSTLYEWLSENVTPKYKLSSLAPVQHDQSKIPLSFAQQRMWFLDQALQGKDIYNIPLVLLLRGTVNKTILEKSLEDLFIRHQSLRTFIKESNGVPELVVSNEKLAIKTLDLSSLSPNVKEDSFLQLANREVQEHFKLSKGPLFKVTLINLDEDKIALIINAHHIIIDGWSIEIFCRELSLLYNAYLKGEQANLPELPMQYKDFALWQRRWLEEGALEETISYWEKKLKGAPELSFPTDEKRLGVPNHKKGACKSFITSDVLEKLHRISQNENVTLFMSLLTAFKILLFRYTGQDDIIVGTPFSNRHYHGIEGIIGFFVNILPLRTKLHPSMSFIELLQHVRSVVAEAYENQDLPFEKLVNQLKISRDINKNPLFQIVLGFHKGRDNSQLNLEGIQDELIVLESGFSHFDVNFNIYEEEGLHLICDYDKDLFEESRIKRLLNHFEILLKEIINNPNQAIHSFPLLTSEEQQEILEKWNDTNISYSSEKKIHELFIEQVGTNNLL